MRSGDNVLLIIGNRFHHRNTQWRRRAAHYRNGSAFDHPYFCKLEPAVPSPPPCQPHRDNRLRLHPPHFASTASIPTLPPPQSIKMRRLAPTSPPCVLAVSFLSIGMSLAEQTMVHLADLSRRCCHLHVLLK